MESHEDEEEVILVVELSGLPAPDAIQSCNGTCTILGLESSQPILQLDNYVFQGVYEDTVGTTMIFKEEGRDLQYLCKTDKKLVMKHVMLKPKQHSSESSAATPQPPAEDLDSPTPSTQPTLSPAGHSPTPVATPQAS